MTSQIYSYRYAEEIIQHPNYTHAYSEINTVISECPLFRYPNKSARNPRLDIIQQLFNTFFDRRFACDLAWEYHPNATNIQDSGLAADYRKDFNGLRIQAEIQFGNMARWYSDIFKFQTAYSQNLIDMGLCIVPVSTIANRMDSNVTNYERCIRELPSAKLSITLPILVIGISANHGTQDIDVSQAQFPNINSITGRGNTENRYRIVNGILNGDSISTINENSVTGPMVRDGEEEDA